MPVTRRAAASRVRSELWWPRMRHFSRMVEHKRASGSDGARCAGPQLLPGGFVVGWQAVVVCALRRRGGWQASGSSSSLSTSSCMHTHDVQAANQAALGIPNEQLDGAFEVKHHSCVPPVQCPAVIQQRAKESTSSSESSTLSSELPETDSMPSSSELGPDSSERSSWELDGSGRPMTSCQH